jgi:hypothetical protein
MDEHQISELLRRANVIDVADLPDPRESPEARRLLESILGNVAGAQGAPEAEALAPGSSVRASRSGRQRRRRLAAIVVVAGAAAAGAGVLALTLTGGSKPTRSPFLVQAIRAPSPSWGAYTRGTTWSFGDTTGNADSHCVGLALTVFGCSGILSLPSAPAQAPSATAPVRTSSTVVVEGGTAAQQRLLRSVLSGMPTTTIERIVISATGSHVSLRMTADDLSMRSLWEEALVAGAFRDLAQAADDAVKVSLVNGEASGVIPPGPEKALTRAKLGDAKTAREVFESAAAKIGEPLSALTIYQPDGVAIAATFESNDPASFLVKKMPAFLAAVGDRWRDYDGTYIRLIDGSGATVWETSSAGRISEGSVGSREDLAACGPVQSWGPYPGPPPCSAK